MYKRQALVNGGQEQFTLPFPTLNRDFGHLSFFPTYAIMTCDQRTMNTNTTLDFTPFWKVVTEQI